MKNVDVDDACSAFIKFIYRAMFECSTPTIDAVVDIARLGVDRNFRMAVTSSQRRELVIQYLSSAGILSLFDAIITIDEIKKGKTYQDLLLEAARRLKCAPAKCIGFEYEENRLEALRAAGMHVVDVKLIEGFPVYSGNDAEVHIVSKKLSRHKILGMPLWFIMLALLAVIMAFVLRHNQIRIFPPSS